MDDQTVRLILDLANSSKDVGELVGKLGELKAKSAEVAEQYHVMARAGDGYTVTTRDGNTAMDEAVRKAVERTQAQKAMNIILKESEDAQKALSTATVTAGNHVATTTTKTDGLGRSVLASSYAFQDFTSQLDSRGFVGGLSAIQNNIPMMLQGIGATTAWAGGISAVMVGLGLAMPKIADFIKTLGESNTKTEAEAMKELADNTKRTADETDKLNKYKKNQSSLEKIRAAQEKNRHPEADTVETFLGRETRDTQGSIAKALQATGRGEKLTVNEAGMSDAQIDAHVDSSGLYVGQFKAQGDEKKALMKMQRDKARAAGQERVNKADFEHAGGILGGASTEDGARATLTALVKESPQNFRKGFGADFAGAAQGRDPIRDAQRMFKQEGAVQAIKLQDIEKDKQFAHSVRTAETADAVHTAALSEAAEKTNAAGVKKDLGKDQRDAKQVAADQKKQAEQRDKRLEDTIKRLGQGNLAQLGSEYLETSVYDRRNVGKKREQIALRMQGQLEAGGMGQMEAAGRGQQGATALVDQMKNKAGKNQGNQMQLMASLKELANIQGQTISVTNGTLQELRAALNANRNSLNKTRTNASNGGP